MNTTEQTRKIRFKEGSKTTGPKSRKWQALEPTHIHTVFPKTGLKQQSIPTFVVIGPQTPHLCSKKYPPQGALKRDEE